jgi:hypothetical protein
MSAPFCFAAMKRLATSDARLSERPSGMSIEEPRCVGDIETILLASTGEHWQSWTCGCELSRFHFLLGKQVDRDGVNFLPRFSPATTANQRPLGGFLGQIYKMSRRGGNYE